MTDRTALVVGGTSGIGAATALRLAADGFAVVAAGLIGTSIPTDLQETADVRHLDLRAPGELEELVASLPRLDVLVNAAGVIHRGSEHRPEVFQQVLDVNLTGALRAAEAAHPLLAESNGSVVNLASMLSFFGGPLVPAYSASKGAVAQLTRSLAVAWAADGIRVNAVAPGWIATELTAQLRADPETTARILSRTPMARWGTATEVAGVIAFLTGPDAAFVTGAVIPVDGGYSSA